MDKENKESGTTRTMDNGEEAEILRNKIHKLVEEERLLRSTAFKMATEIKLKSKLLRLKLKKYQEYQRKIKAGRNRVWYNRNVFCAEIKQRVEHYQSQKLQLAKLIQQNGENPNVIEKSKDEVNDIYAQHNAIMEEYNAKKEMHNKIMEELTNFSIQEEIRYNKLQLNYNNILEMNKAEDATIAALKQELLSPNVTKMNKENTAEKPAKIVKSILKSSCSSTSNKRIRFSSPLTEIFTLSSGPESGDETDTDSDQAIEYVPTGNRFSYKRKSNNDFNN